MHDVSPPKKKRKQNAFNTFISFFPLLNINRCIIVILGALFLLYFKFDNNFDFVEVSQSRNKNVLPQFTMRTSKITHTHQKKLNENIETIWFRELVNNREQFIYYLYLNYKHSGLFATRHSRNMTFNVKRIEIYMLKCLGLHFNRFVDCVHVAVRQSNTQSLAQSLLL